MPTATLRLLAAAAALTAGLLPSGAPAAAATPPARQAAHVVFLVSNAEDANSYESGRTLTAFAAWLHQQHGYRTTVLTADMPESGARFRSVAAVAGADLLVIFCRRLALPPEQLTTIKNHLNAGKPLVALRTANHAFSVRGAPAPGHVAWWEFVADVLGAENRGYGPAAAGTTVAIAPGARGHPILRGLPDGWHSKGNVYFSAPLLDRRATVLLTGTVDGRVEPIAWTRIAGESRVFYTSLGHPADFDEPPSHLRTLLVNGIRWALGGN
jgi:hypothetical protein